MRQKRYWIAGLIGALCFGIGDWLLGFVDPAMPEGDVFYFIRMGHGVQYSEWRNIVTLVLAMIGICFYLPAFKHIADVVKEERTRGILGYAFAFCAVGWTVLHLIVTFNVACYHEAFVNAGAKTASQISGGLVLCSAFGLYPAMLFIAVPLLLLSILILLEKTVLRKLAFCFSPLVWMLIWFTAAQEIPTSPFSYGLYTFCMNGGMFVWFLYLLTRKTPTNAQETEMS